MDLVGQRILVRLLPSGIRALKGLVPAKGAFQTLALSSDALGVWVLVPAGPQATASQSLGGAPVMLIKWEYLAAIAFDYSPEPYAAKAKIGFSS